MEIFLKINCKVQETQLYDPSLTLRWPQGANLMSSLESQALVSYYLQIHIKAPIAIIKEMLSSE